jgi:ABC-type sugar transport system ATPase subunit
VKKGEILALRVWSARQDGTERHPRFDPVLSVHLFGSTRVVLKHPSQAYALRSLHSETAGEESLFSFRSVPYNLTQPRTASFNPGFASTAQKKTDHQRIRRKHSIKTASYATKIQNLSGGNQQKVVNSRRLAAKPES